MKITSRASDYALLTLMYLASRPSDEISSVKRVAQELNISLRFLANIANKLASAHLIVASRGQGGGMRLAKNQDEITVSEVIEAVDGPIQTMFCQNTQEICNRERLCHMKHFWDDIQGFVTKRLRSATIGTLAKGTFVHEERRPSAA